MLENNSLSGGTATMRGTRLTIQTIKELCEAIAKMPGNLEERFINPEDKLVGNLAMVWTRNEVTLDDEVVIEGMNALSLHKVDGKWKITNIFDAAD